MKAETDAAVHLPESPCWAAGVCIQHTAAGRAMAKLRRRFMAELLHLFPRGHRQLLEEGFLVVRLVGRPVESFFGEDIESDDADLAIEEKTAIFWHVSYILLNPVVPVFMPMACVDAEMDSSAPFADTMLELRVVGLFSTEPIPPNQKIKIPNHCRWQWMR